MTFAVGGNSKIESVAQSALVAAVYAALDAVSALVAAVSAALDAVSRLVLFVPCELDYPCFSLRSIWRSIH